MAASSRTRRGSMAGRRRLLSHRRLLSVEALLVIGLLQDLGEAHIHATTWPNAVKVVFSMALVVGLFGVLLLVLERWTRTGLDRAEGVIRKLPLPTPLLLIHLAVLVTIYGLYSWHLEMPPW